MDWLGSSIRQTKNYAHLFTTRAISVGNKYWQRGSAAFSTPRVPHTTPDKPPSAFKNAKNTIKAFFMSPTLILDSPTLSIFVGSALNTASESTYTQARVTHVLNCAGHDDILPLFYEECIERYFHLSLRDESDEETSFTEDERFCSELRLFLKDVFNPERDETHKVTLLVHCVFGRSRSVAISIIILFLYYYHINEPKTMIQCYEYIGQRRKVIALQRRFLIEITNFESKFKHDERFRNMWLDIFKK